MFDVPLPNNKKFERKKKRYGWFRRYDGHINDPTWTLVARRSGVPRSSVYNVACALDEAASKARAGGYIGDFDFDICSAATDIPAEDIAAAFRVMCDIGYISDDHITNWLELQPPQEDPTAAERQRNHRARVIAGRAVRAGNAKPDQVELLTVAEHAALEKLAKLSRVTSEPPQHDQETIRPLVLDRIHGLNPDGAALVRLRNDLAARHWLLGKLHDNTHGTNYGVASKIVADNFGCNRLNADGIIRRWLSDQMEQDHTTLATIISSAFEQSITNEAFRNVVESRITEYVRERTQGASLPLGMTAITGGRS